MTMTRRRIHVERHLAKSILYVTALLGDRPRQVDGYIHYFGETPQCASDAGAWSSRVNASRSRPLALTWVSRRVRARRPVC